MSESNQSYHIAGFNGKASVRTSREYRRINERRKKKAMNKIKIDMPNKALNDAVEEEVKGVLESMLESNPRVPEDSILGMAVRLKQLSDEVKNGKA